jgi:hypothetical protein
MLAITKSGVEVCIVTEHVPKLVSHMPQAGTAQVAGIEGFWSNIALVLAPWIAKTCIPNHPESRGDENTTVMLSEFKGDVARA